MSMQAMCQFLHCMTLTLPDAPLVVGAAHAGPTGQSSIVFGVQLAPIPLLHKLICKHVRVQHISMTRLQVTLADMYSSEASVLKCMKLPVHVSEHW